MKKTLNFNKSKKNIILLIVLILSISCILVSFAFFVVQVTAPAKTDLELTSLQDEFLKINPGETINLHATLSNFSAGDGSLSSNSTSLVELFPSTEAGSATANYNVYFNILNNEYEYSQSVLTPEIILKITNPEGDLIEEIKGLEYVTVADANNVDITGFDITNKTGYYAIATEYLISTNNIATGTSQSWNFELQFVNLSHDQSLNSNKNMEAKVLIQTDDVSLGDICANTSFSKCLTNNINIQEGMIHHSENLQYSILDNSYRYSGDSETINYNYVCFGSEEEVCSEADMYRIMGVFDNKVKLIKQTSIGVLPWNATGATYFENSSLRSYLNNDFYNSINSKYQNMIVDYEYKVGTIYSQDYTMAVASAAEKNILLTNKIGLMNTSDYTYTIPESYWKKATPPKLSYFYSYDHLSWMFSGIKEWTINSKDTTYPFIISNSGGVYQNHYNTSLDTRPVFYLNESVLIVNGNGKIANPFRIDM